MYKDHFNFGTKGSTSFLNDLLQKYLSPKIRHCFRANHVFRFKPATIIDVRKKILSFDDLEGTESGDTPADITKASIEVYLISSQKLLITHFREKFPSALKFTKVSPFFSRNSVDYWTYHFLSYMSKLFEKVAYKQLDELTKDRLSSL